MEKVDQALEKLVNIKATYKDFLDKHSYVTEADTRVNLIDKILTTVLFWPESEISRETHAENGYLDYSLNVNGKNFVCVEAKKHGKSFIFPKDKKRKYHKINGAFSKDTNVYLAVTQAREYCDNSAIRYAIVTNGNTWIIYRAIREDMPWKEGNARVFYSIDEIIENFIEFWNLLSYDTISQGSLDSEFSSTTSAERQMARVLNFLLQPDVPLWRNSLHTELHPIISHFFEDIADPNFIETLKNCYVYTRTIDTVAKDIDFVIKDSIPKFLEQEGTIDLYPGKNTSGVFGKIIQRALTYESGQLFLLLGGIGSGKTTFQKRYQLTVGKEVLDENAIWFSIDFLKPPELSMLEEFVWQELLTQLRDKYQSPHLETRKNIKRVFKDKIDALKETALYGLEPESKEYETLLSNHLSQWQNNLSDYVPGLLSIAKPRRDLSVVLFFDNVDQLSPAFQAQIFLLAQRITEKVKSVTIIALREESYYAASVQKVFTAYINRKFHIASPRFRRMIAQRINFVLKIMDEKDTTIQKFKEFIELSNRTKITDFLKIVEYSIFERNKNIARFIDHLCFGNMRAALQMFSTFLVSGATDVDKMLRIYKRDGNYFVAFHEFIRSIMLGERMYYKEAFSSIANIFECGQEKNSSHFTSLRILTILDSHRTESSKEGEGFYEITKILSIFEDTFNNKLDFLKSLNRLVNRQLVETNTKIFESITGSTHIRLTSAGWYYLKYLVNSFAYLDLVFQDTPINDESTLRVLVESIKKVGNLSDPEEDKVAKMEERFKRITTFLKYLEQEEQKEFNSYYFEGKTGLIYSTFLPSMWEAFNGQKEWILDRLKGNKEKYADEQLGFNFSDSEESIIDDKDEDNDDNDKLNVENA